MDAATDHGKKRLDPQNLTIIVSQPTVDPVKLWEVLAKLGGPTINRGEARTATQIPGTAIQGNVRAGIMIIAAGATSMDGTNVASAIRLPISSVELHVVPDGEPAQIWHTDMDAANYATLVIPVTPHYGTEYQTKGGWNRSTSVATMHSGKAVHRGPANDTGDVRRIIAVVFTAGADANVVNP